MNRIKWSEIVEKLNKNAPDIYMECPGCISPESCIDELPMTTPVNIVTLNSCCSCLLSYVLDLIPNIGRIYLQSKTSNEYTSIYILNDVVLEISEDRTLIIPIDKIQEFLELLRELDNESSISITKWLEDEGLK
uniref:Uncharacterized protein n=1 Tax=Ignisphaera aggregans TaxID=334771 RepID=A0A7J3QGT8_9CREN